MAVYKASKVYEVPTTIHLDRVSVRVGVSRSEHKPTNVVAAKDTKPPDITSERSPTVTIIGAGNAVGTQIPPYLIFAGAGMHNSLIDNCTNGTSDTVLALPDTVLALPDTVQDLPDTVLDLPDTELDLPDSGNITLIDEADPLPDEDESDILANNESSCFLQTV
ncbi:Hypothetical predicted protein [Mytilus galloprovincialis]|uniref:Uncharacterized protein n=1 Tax=Mytilus galloprovincialis TaxID=29158 RepID=A0A8B6HF49_MYTGA|nr:Hypothetical predicted protein [Mytilus galloprovincialis]